jgi:hypothetical protein
VKSKLLPTLFAAAALAACSAPPPPPAAAPTLPTPRPAVPRLLPNEYVREGDTRDLATATRAFVLDVFETESLALQREAQLSVAAEPKDLPRAQRVAADRAGFTPQLEAVRAATGAGAAPSPHDPSPLDRYLLAYLEERLRTESYAPLAVEAWWRANRRFLASDDLTARDAAIAVRADAIRSLAASGSLRQIAQRILEGELDEAERNKALTELVASDPRGILPELGPAALVVPIAGEAATAAAGGGGVSGLPRLDGSALPLAAVPNF